MLNPLLSPKTFFQAVGIGIATALILSAVMIPAFLAGLSPMPKPPSLAFAEAFLGTGVPLLIGLLFHVVYVTFWSVLFVDLSGGRRHHDLGSAFRLALGLWLLALIVFFPINGWGILGLQVSWKLIPASLVPHLLFAVVLWGLCRLTFGSGQGQRA